MYVFWPFFFSFLTGVNYRTWHVYILFQVTGKGLNVKNQVVKEMISLIHLIRSLRNIGDVKTLTLQNLTSVTV